MPELYLSRFDRGEDFLYRAVCRLERRTYRAADVVIATNESYRAGRDRAAAAWPPERRVRGPQRARPSSGSGAVTPEPALKRGKPHLLCYLGVMGPQDGVDYALRALADLRDELGRDDWHAVFVGAGDTFDDDGRAVASALGLADRVEFTGRIPDEDLLRYLSTADVCLSPGPAQPAQRRVDHEQGHGVHGDGPADRLVRPARGAGLGRRGGRLRAAPTTSASSPSLIARAARRPRTRARAMGEIGLERVSGPLSWTNSEKALLAAYESATRGR